MGKESKRWLKGCERHRIQKGEEQKETRNLQRHWCNRREHRQLVQVPGWWLIGRKMHNGFLRPATEGRYAARNYFPLKNNIVAIKSVVALQRRILFDCFVFLLSLFCGYPFSDIVDESEECSQLVKALAVCRCGVLFPDADWIKIIHCFVRISLHTSQDKAAVAFWYFPVIPNESPSSKPCLSKRSRFWIK